MEMNALDSVKADFEPRTFVILGSGPLPLTSLCISQYYSDRHRGRVTCHNVDQNVKAVSLSSDSCRTLGHNEKDIHFQCADATSAKVDLFQYDVIYLAALVGACSETKQEILSSVVGQMRPGAIVVLRSAHSLRTLLYPVYSQRYLSTRYRTNLLIHLLR